MQRDHIAIHVTITIVMILCPHVCNSGCACDQNNGYLIVQDEKCVKKKHCDD